jgi:transcriptional regulator with XRE-family HTH domain
LDEVQEFCKARRGRVAELAAELGVAQPQVSGWLNYSRQPSGEAALRIQRWLVDARGRERAGEVQEDLKRRELVQGLRGGFQ